MALIPTRERRALHIALHWAQFGLLLGLISTQTPTPPWAIAYAAVALGWSALALAQGRYTQRAARLDPFMAAVHRWHHRALYGLVAGSGALALLWAWDQPLGGQPIRLQYWLFLLFLLSSLHAVFHLWRHTALNDGALRIITPKPVHRIL